MTIKKLIFLFNLWIIANPCYSQEFSSKQIEKALDDMDYETFDDKDKDFLVVCTELYYKSKEINYKEGQLRALIKLSFFRLNAFKDYEKIISDSKEAEKLALSLDDFGNYSLAQIQRAWAYMHMDFLDQSENTLKEASKSLELIRDEHMKHAVKANYYFVFVCIYDKKNDAELRKHYNEKVFSEALQMSNRGNDRLNWILNSSRLLIGDYLGTKEMDKAEHYLKIQEEYIKKSNNFLDWAVYHKTKAEFEFENQISNKNYLDSSIYHFKKAESFSIAAKRPQLTELIYQEMANVYSSKKDPKNQAYYLKKARDISDSLTVINRINNNKLNLKVEEKKETEETSKNINLKRWISVFASFLFLTSLYLLYKKRFSKKKKETSHEKHQKTEKIKNRITEKPITINTLKELALNKDASFYLNFKKIFPDFEKKLLQLNSTMKSTDIEFCALLKLKIETKQIASIKNISVRAVENKKYRIRKKLNIATHEDIYLWINNV